MCEEFGELDVFGCAVCAEESVAWVIEGGGRGWVG